MDTHRLRLKQLASQIETGRSLKLASARQERMLPEVPKLEKYEIDVYFKAAAELSGDFYDFFRVNEQCWGIVVADVTGHGVEAGIIMGMAKQTVSIYGRQIEAPDDVLSLSNEELHRSLDARTFVSLSYAVLDVGTGSVRFARAGQCKPILLNPGWVMAEPQVVESKGLALGVDKGPRFRKIIETIELKLEPGDIFFQYTDGVVEAMNRDKEQFGEARLMDLLKRYARTSATEITEIVTESLREFTRGCEQEDDITIVVLKALEPQARPGRAARFDPPEFAGFTPGKPQAGKPPAGDAGPAPSPGAQPPGDAGGDPPEWLK